jgi:osmotically-inducible protein OsmY
MTKSSIRKAGALAVFLAPFLVIAAVARMGEAPAASNAVSSESMTKAVQGNKTPKGKKLRKGRCSTDAKLEVRVRSALANNTRLKGSEFNVEAKDRVVTLSGKAKEPTHRKTAFQTARAVNCVKSVVNMILCAEGFKQCGEGCIPDADVCIWPKPQPKK